MSAFHVRGLTCSRGGRAIVTDVDLDAGPGEMIALVGVNGSGKSTLIQSLVGLLPLDAGRVLVDDQDVTALSVRQRAKRIAYVAQEEHPLDELRVDELVGLGRIPFRAPWSLQGQVGDRQAVADALEAVDLTYAAQRPCHQLSGGERRRALLARGLAQACDVLVLDEPTNHLDIGHQAQLLSTIRRTGRTVIAAIHDLTLAWSHFDRVVVLHGGRVHAVGAPYDVLDPSTVSEVFQVETARLTDPRTGREHLVLGSGTIAQPAGQDRLTRLGRTTA